MYAQQAPAQTELTTEEHIRFQSFMLVQLEKHTKVIKGWVIFFGIMTVLWLVFVALAMGAALQDPSNF